MPDFKDMLKYFRAREGLSQNELAKCIGVSASTISMYEVGNREPDFETEEKIADFFNTDLNTLRGRDIEITIETQRIGNSLNMSNRILHYLTALNAEGQRKVIEYAEDLAQNPNYTISAESLLNAAHERTDIEVTEEMKNHDNDIIDDDNF